MFDGIDVLACYADRATFALDAGSGRLVLKVDQQPARSCNEVDAMRRAAAVGLPVAAIVAYDPTPPTVLALSMVDGEPLSAASPEAAVDAGRHVRRFHDLGGGPTFDSGHTTWEGHVLAAVGPEIEYLERAGHVSAAAAARLRRVFETAAPALAGRGTARLHGDLQPSHVLVDGDRVAAFLDWADSEPGDPLFDIAVLTLFDDEVLEPFLDGYDADASFRRAADELLPVYRLFRHVGAVRWLLDRGYRADDHLERIAA